MAFNQSGNRSTTEDYNADDHISFTIFGASNTSAPDFITDNDKTALY